MEVHACFLLESRINDCVRGLLDGNVVEREGWKIKTGQSTKFVEKKNTRSGQDKTHEATFSIELNVNLNRTKNMQVYQEKYRLIFWAQMDGKTYWTMSLPMVVITGGNQNCQCLASIMWQCFSTDVFNIPTKPLQSMPWSEVAEMLQAKIKSLPSNRILTEENINHLKERLLGSAEEADDKQVSLEKFCSELLPQEVSANETEEKKEPFTFWMWYLSIYNLIKTYLLDFWNNGWIEGFLSKEMAVRKLKMSKTFRAGMFLLRFSDQQIDKSQGKDTVFGKLATSMLIKNNGQCQEVCHVDVIGHDKLAVMHLADILLRTEDKAGKRVYKYLYPKSNTHCEILFQGYHRKTQGPVVVPPYIGVRNVFKVDLEELDEDFSKLELGGKRRLSTFRNSGDHWNSPEEPQGDTEVKRLKSNKSDPLPLLQQNLDNTSLLVDEVDKPPIVVDKTNTVEVETGMGLGKINMTGEETYMATGTNMAEDRTRKLRNETNMESEYASQTAMLPGSQRPNECDSSVLRKLLTEQLNASVNKTSIAIIQNKNSNFMYTENTVQTENGSIKYTKSGQTENKRNSHAAQNIHDRFPVNNNCAMVQMTPSQSQTIPCQWTLNDSELDQSNSEAIQPAMSFHVNGSLKKARNQGANTLNPDESHIISPYQGEILNEVQPSRATIGGNQYDSVSLLDPTRFMEPGDHQSIELNDLFEANQIASSVIDEYQVVAEPSMGPRSNLIHSGDRLFDSVDESIQEYLMGLPPEKAVDTLKPFLETLAPHFILKITPIKKIILEIITPFLKTLTPELNQMVIQALQNSIEESQSPETPNQIESDEEDVAAAGLGQTELTPAEIADVLSMSESDSLPNIEIISNFGMQK